MSIFRTRGFDSIIGKGMGINGELFMEPNTTLVIEGKAACTKIEVTKKTDKLDKRTTLRVSGQLCPDQGGQGLGLVIDIHNVVITGTVVCTELRVGGTLAVKAGAMLKAEKIFYRELIVETGAIMLGEMIHLDGQAEMKLESSLTTPAE